MYAWLYHFSMKNKKQAWIKPFPCKMQASGSQDDTRDLRTVWGLLSWTVFDYVHMLSACAVIASTKNV
jgi:hypothetical protein